MVRAGLKDLLPLVWTAAAAFSKKTATQRRLNPIPLFFIFMIPLTVHTIRGEVRHLNRRVTFTVIDESSSGGRGFLNKQLTGIWLVVAVPPAAFFVILYEHDLRSLANAIILLAAALLVWALVTVVFLETGSSADGKVLNSTAIDSPGRRLVLLAAHRHEKGQGFALMRAAIAEVPTGVTIYALASN